MSIRMMLYNRSDRPSMHFRVVVAILPKIFGGSIVTSQFANTFQISNQGTCNNTMLLPADQDAGVKFLYDKLHYPSNGFVAARAAGGLTKEPTKCVKLWIKRKKAGPIVFDTTNSTLVNRPLAIYVIPYESFGTSQLDNVARVDGFLRMYYKDF